MPCEDYRDGFPLFRLERDLESAIQRVSDIAQGGQLDLIRDQVLEDAHTLLIDTQPRREL